MAIETAGSFVTTTVNGKSVLTTPTSSTLSVSSNSLVSPSVVPSSDAVENKKIIMGMDVKVAFSDVGASLTVQVSHNGTDWVDSSVLSSDVTENLTGVKTFLVDLADVYAPYFRIHFNGSSAAGFSSKTVGTSGTLQFFLSY